jgi:hypothetical protein
MMAFLEPFVWGVVVGYFWFPLWKILKKIWAEAKLASKEWKDPNGKSD